MCVISITPVRLYTGMRSRSDKLVDVINITHVIINLSSTASIWIILLKLIIIYELYNIITFVILTAIGKE